VAFKRVIAKWLELFPDYPGQMIDEAEETLATS